MKDTFFLIHLTLSIWGFLLFITLKFGFLHARNTLEVGLRNQRMGNLKFRFFLGWTFGLVLLLYSLFLLFNIQNNPKIIMGYIAFILIFFSEIYFLIRYRQLTIDFRKYSLKAVSIDQASPYMPLGGTFLSMLSMIQ